MRVFHGADDVKAAAGQLLGSSDWILIDQPRIDAFADVTGDHQWIHVDRERAAAGPFGTTIAHGLLTLSLAPAMLAGIYDVRGIAMSINYGYNRVRYVSPVPVGSRVRGTATLTAIDEVPGGLQATISLVIEIEGAAKPACVADCLVRLVL